MSQEVCSDAHFRVVRDGEAGHYYLQVGFGNHYRSFSAFKLGKFDVLRDQAKQEALQQQAAPAENQQG